LIAAMMQENANTLVKSRMLHYFVFSRCMVLYILCQDMLEISMFNVLFQYEEYSKKQEEEILKKGQEVSDKIFYVKQNISNSCGTIAIIHSIANSTDK
jgi:hypothetical protein